jgi:POT family proton-dependent oligopeptide transporter
MSTPRGFFGQPAGMSTLFFTEMWERFSYYGMRALLTLFLTKAVTEGGYGIDDRSANAIYGLYTAIVYLVSLPGGWIADRLIGAQRAVLWGGIIIAVGHIVLGVSGQNPQVFYLGLVFIVIGTGLLKPNIAALVTQQYPEGGYRRDAGVTLYYMSVNLGGFLGPLIAGFLGEKIGWHVGFFSAAVGMILGVVYYLMTRDRLGTAGQQPAPPMAGKAPLNPRRWLLGFSLATIAIVGLFWSGVIDVKPAVLLALCKRFIIVVSVLYFAYLLLFAGLTVLERKRALMMMALFLACALFWSGFEQAGSSFTLFADRYTDRMIGGWAFPASWFQVMNPLFIVIFAPFFSAFWVRMGVRNLDPSAPVKFALGLIGMALGFLIMAGAAKFVAAGQMVGVAWLTSVYLIHTFGELCLSPVGISAFSKLAPARMVGQSLGVWFTATSLGNLIAGQIAGGFDADNKAAMPGQMMYIFWFGLISAAVLLIVGMAINRWIAASKE